MSATFNPQMLTLARESRGMTQGELARVLCVTQGKISKYESGMLSVSPDDLKSLSKQLDYPPEFFFQQEPIKGAGSSCLYHRKRQSMPVQELRKIQAEINVIRLQVAHLLRGAEIETENKFYRMDIDDFENSPEEVANLVRRAWGLPLGPVNNLVAAVEDAGGIVFRYSFGTRKLDAISQWLPGMPPLFFVNTDIPADRLRFTLAHEIGHVLMHRVPTENQEQEADRFAAELLMPETEIGPHLRPLSIQKAAALKPYWKTSMASIIKRSFDLGLIGDAYYRKLFSQLSRLGYRTVEPVTIPDEEPATMREIVEVHLRDHRYSVSELCKLVRGNERDFRSLYLPEQQRLRIAD
jgi:Zn-dependent peptidase ImmA (M78 family)